eukprot:UN30156
MSPKNDELMMKKKQLQERLEEIGQLKTETISKTKSDSVSRNIFQEETEKMANDLADAQKLITELRSEKKLGTINQSNRITGNWIV